MNDIQDKIGKRIYESCLGYVSLFIKITWAIPALDKQNKQILKLNSAMASIRHQAQSVQKLDRSIRPINHYPAENYRQN